MNPVLYTSAVTSASGASFHSKPPSASVVICTSRRSSRPHPCTATVASATPFPLPSTTRPLNTCGAFNITATACGPSAPTTTPTRPRPNPFLPTSTPPVVPPPPPTPPTRPAPTPSPPPPTPPAPPALTPSKTSPPAPFSPGETPSPPRRSAL